VIVDSSAVIAVLLREPGWERLVDALTDADTPPRIAAPSLVETGMVLTARLGVPGKTLLVRLLQEAGIRTLDFGADHWPVAVDAYLKYGKGRHPAALNFGDCMTYAVASLANEPLLCVDADFPKTDLALVEI
jgi:ribonuclease VapC